MGRTTIVKNSKQDAVLVEQAVRAVEAASGLDLAVLDKAVRKGATRSVFVRVVESGIELPVVTHRWAVQAGVGNLAMSVAGTGNDTLLVADYISPGMAARLREMRISFIDTAGNACLDLPPIFVSIEGRRPADNSRARSRSPTSRAFEPAGMMLVHALLVWPELVAHPYRDMAKLTNTSVGTVGHVVNGLSSERLVAGEGSNRHLHDTSRLARRWMEAWPSKLRPKHWLGTFTTLEEERIERLDLREYGAYRGGETAGAAYTGHLRPAVTTLYVREERRARLFGELQLRRPAGDPLELGHRVDVLNAFWNAELDVRGASSNDIRSLVHPLLACADLLVDGDPRNIETARILHDDWLEADPGRAR